MHPCARLLRVLICHCLCPGQVRVDPRPSSTENTTALGLLSLLGGRRQAIVPTGPLFDPSVRWRPLFMASLCHQSVLGGL